MANSTIPGLVAVSVPALTDLFGVRQSGDARDKKLTVTQLLTLIPSGGDVTKVGTPADNQLGVWTGDGTIEGTTALEFNGSTFTMNLGGGDLRLTGKLELQGANRPAVLDESASNTNPTFAPLGNSPTSGLGGQGSSVSLIAFSKPAIEVTSLNAKILQAYETDRTVTAFAGGGQGSATILDSSFSILTTVATTGDSVKLPALFQGNDPCTVIYIKNDGANAADVFPASGDDLGAGVDTAVSLAAGESASFIATSGSSTWTPFIVDTKGSGGAQISGTPANNQLGVWVNSTDIEGDANFQVVSTLLRGALGNGPGIANINGVNILPRHGDPNTGLQNVGDDRLAMVAGGVAGITLIEASSAVYQVNQTNVGITAFAGGGSASATQLNSSYNVVDTVATTGDSVKFSSLVSVGIIGYVKNDGANALDLFPAGGDDLGFGVGVAISVPAGKSVAFLGSVISATWTQLIFEDGVSFPLLAPDGDATDPSYSFASDPDTGFFLSNPATIEVTTAGVSHFEFINTGFGGKIASGPRMLDEAPTATNPNLVPNKADTDSGIGQIAANTVSFIAGGAEAFRATFAGGGRAIFAAAVGTLASGIPPITVVSDLNTGIYFPASDQMTFHVGGVDLIRLVEGAADQVIVAPTLQDAAATPSLAFGDGDTGFYENSDDILSVSIAGVRSWAFTQSNFTSVSGTGPALANEVASATNPTFTPNSGDGDTGIGWTSADQLSLVAGGVEAFRLAESAGVITNTFLGDLLAAGGGGAGPALLNTSASPSVPTLIPNQADPDTGITRDGINGVSMVGGGLGCIRARNIGGARAVGFYTTTPIIQQTGVAVTDVAIHAALVALGLITA